MNVEEPFHWHQGVGSREPFRRQSIQYGVAMTARGVRKHDTDLVTSRMLGSFRDDAKLRRQFLGITA